MAILSLLSTHQRGGNHTDYDTKAEDLRRQSMREVLAAVCRLRDRLMELSSQTPSGGPSGNGWSSMRLRD